MEDPKLPGVTLHYLRARRFKNGFGQNKAEISLEATIEDDKVWEEVERMFTEGFRIYTQEDFKGELVGALRTEVVHLEQRVKDVEFEKNRLEAEVKLLREELEEKRGILDGFSKSLRGE